MRSTTKKIGKKVAPRLYENIRSLRRDIRDIKARVEVSDDRLTRLQDIYKQADPYQPIYGIQGVGTPQRDSRDRCEAIYDYFKHDIRGLRTLDIGCFFGYLSFHLADRGASVEAWDNNHINIEVAKRAQDITGIAVDFKVKEFNKETVSTIQPGQYDTVFILSVLHWTTALQGLEYVQDCMKELMERVPMVIVELAQKGEGSKLYWDKAVPKNDLDIFSKCKGLKIEKIGEFPTHLSNKKRPIYVVKRDSLVVNKHVYPIKSYKLRAYPNAEQWRPIPARYFVSDKVFIKEYNYENKIEETKRYLVNEINFLLQNSSQHNKNPIKRTPKILDYEIGDYSTKIVLQLIDGSLLSDVVNELTAAQKNKIASDVLETMTEFEIKGLYHNDLRSWNIMLSKNGEVHLIDMEMVATSEYENNIVSYFWVLCFLMTGKSEEKTRNKSVLPPRKEFSGNNRILEIYDLAKDKTSTVTFRNLHQTLSRKREAEATKS